jgi:hypothetical protein
MTHSLGNIIREVPIDLSSGDFEDETYFNAAGNQIDIDGMEYV